MNGLTSDTAISQSTAQKIALNTTMNAMIVAAVFIILVALATKPYFEEEESEG